MLMCAKIVRDDINFHPEIKYYWWWAIPLTIEGQFAIKGSFSKVSE